MKRSLPYIVTIVAILVIVFSLLVTFTDIFQAKGASTHKQLHGEVVLPGGESIRVYIADTPSDRSKGLSVIPQLNQGEGMLFVFESLDIYPFWMKDMSYPIDILWMNAAGKIVFQYEQATPEDYLAGVTYAPSQQALYVLELPAESINLYELQIGEYIGIK